MAHTILQLLKWWKLKYFISSPIMDFWNKETLNCLKIVIWKLNLWEMAERGCLFLSNEKCLKIAGMLKDLEWFK